jgi:ribosome biogenesis ATPase
LKLTFLHFRILRVLSSKLRLTGDFDFDVLARQTPGYVGADLAALTGAAGIIAVKRIFQDIATGKIQLPATPPVNGGEIEKENDNESMQVDDNQVQMLTDGQQDIPIPVIPITSSIGSNSMANFLIAHPNPLTPEQLEPLYITYDDFLNALPTIQPSSKREGFSTIPDVAWSDIGALHSTRDELRMTIVQPILRPELFKAVGIDAPSGVLLWGPPGCGKTLLAKAVANESRANFISIKGPELLNKVCVMINKSIWYLL